MRRSNPSRRTGAHVEGTIGCDRDAMVCVNWVMQREPFDEVLVATSGASRAPPAEDGPGDADPPRLRGAGHLRDRRPAGPAHGLGFRHEDRGCGRRADRRGRRTRRRAAQARPRADPARRAQRRGARRLGVGERGAARDVAEGRADQGIVCCWTGTGASIAANKVPGIRAALCGDAETADGARKWNDANVLALSLRTTSPALLARSWTRGSPASRRGRGRRGERPPSTRSASRRTCKRELARAKKRGGAPDAAPLWTRPNRVMQAIPDLGLAHR